MKKKIQYIVASSILSSACLSSPTFSLSTTIHPHKTLTTQRAKIIAEEVYGILNHYRVTDDLDKKSLHIKTLPETAQKPKGYDLFVERLEHTIKAGKPLDMLLVGFPFKSANQEKKVLGVLPDMAERKSLEYLQQMADEVREIYAPGVRITILCDGIAFGEFLGISDDTVQAYENTLEKLAEDLPSITLLTTKGLQEKFHLGSPSEIREYIDHFAPSDNVVKAKLKNDAKTKDAFQTLEGRLAVEFDCAQGRKLLKQSHGTDLKNRTFSVMSREARLRNFIKENFPQDQFIRLTVHYSKDIAEKFGIKLSPTSFITPYHGVYVEESDGRWSIRFRKDVPLSEYKEVTKVIHGVPCPYFKRTSN